MKQLFQLMILFDWLALPRTIFQTFTHADWRTARETSGAAGVLAEAGASLIGSNSFPFFVPLDSPWDASDIQALLAGKGIKLWGVGFFNDEIFFRVSRKQAAWAQYVLQRAGVPLLHGLLAESPPTDGGRGPTSGQRTAGQAASPAKEQDSLDRLLSKIERFLP